MLLMLLAACFHSNARPYDDYLRDLELLDTDDTSVDDTGAIDDTGSVDDTGGDSGDSGDSGASGPTFDQCSTLGGDPIEVTFVNHTGVHIDLYYVTADCQALNTVLIANGDSNTRPSAAGEVWRAWDAFGGTGWIDEVRIGTEATVELTP